MSEIEVLENRKSLDGKDGEELDSTKWEENPETRTEESKKKKTTLKHKPKKSAQFESKIWSKIQNYIHFNPLKWKKQEFWYSLEI